MTRKEKLESLINGNLTEQDIKVKLVYPKTTGKGKESNNVESRV